MSSKKFNELVKDKSKEDLLKLYTDLKRECMNLRIAMRSPNEGFKPSNPSFSHVFSGLKQFNEPLL